MVGTLAHWSARGISQGRMRTLIASGDLVRLRHGTYATGGAMAWAAGNPRRGHVLHVYAAMDMLGQHAVPSHQSAAVMHGLSLFRHPGDVVSLTFPPGIRRSGTRARVVSHAAAIPPAHVTRMYQVRITDAARTAADLARTLPFMEAVVVTDAALHTDLASKPEMLWALDGCQRSPGVQRAKQAIEFASAGAESVFESCGRVILHERGVEAPQVQVTLHGERFQYSVDLYWPRHKTIVEFDGAVKYETTGDLLDQFERDRILRDAGYKVIHVTWNELFKTPDVVVRRIRRAFAADTPF